MGNYYYFLHALAFLILLHRANSYDDNHGESKTRTLSFSLFQHEGLNKTGYIMVNGIVGAALSATTAGFGTIYVANAPLTTKINPSSDAAVGSVEGTYVTISMDGLLTLCIVKFNINLTNHKGSISVLGSFNNSKLSVVPVVGGTGDFMLVQGFVTITPVVLQDVTNVVYEVEFHLQWPPYAQHHSSLSSKKH